MRRSGSSKNTVVSRRCERRVQCCFWRPVVDPLNAISGRDNTGLCGERGRECDVRAVQNCVSHPRRSGELEEHVRVGELPREADGCASGNGVGGGSRGHFNDIEREASERLSRGKEELECDHHGVPRSEVHRGDDEGLA